MTDEEIATEYLRREKAANATQAGADPLAIIKAMSEEYGLYWSQIRQAVLDTIARPN